MRTEAAVRTEAAWNFFSKEEDAYPLIGPPPHPDEWKLRKFGACVGAGPASEWVTAPPGNPDNSTRRAQAVCKACPVLSECRNVADHLESESLYGGSLTQLAGVWGGETAGMRRRRRSAEQRSAA